MQNGSAFWRVASFAEKYKARIMKLIDENKGRRVEANFERWWQTQVCYYLVTGGSWLPMPHIVTESAKRNISIFYRGITALISQMNPHEHTQLTAVLLLELDQQSDNLSLSRWLNVHKKHYQNCRTVP